MQAAAGIPVLDWVRAPPCLHRHPHAPDTGLPLLRVTAGSVLLVEAYRALSTGLLLGPAPLQASSIAFGMLLVAGSWAPAAGSLVALEARWDGFSARPTGSLILLATFGAGPLH